jgi:membrane-associated protease RseP (regulator of RpoE activity)
VDQEENCVQENENQVVTAKVDPEPEAGPSAPKAVPKKKGRRALWIVLAVLGACLLLGVGAVVGGGAVYGLTRARSRANLAPLVGRWVLPREMPRQELPGMPGRGTMVLESGAWIVEVVADSPADQAGLREGDLVVAVDGQALDAENDLATVIGKHKPGDEVTFEIASLGSRLGRENREVTVTLAENPDAAGNAYLGVRFVSMPGQGSDSGRGMYWFHEFNDDADGDTGSLRERLFQFRLPRG